MNQGAGLGQSIKNFNWKIKRVNISPDDVLTNDNPVLAYTIRLEIESVSIVRGYESA